MTIKTRNIITTVAIIALIIISAVFYTVAQPVLWNNGTHSCGGNWIENGVVLTGKDHHTVEYLYICDNCGTALRTPTHY